MRPYCWYLRGAELQTMDAFPIGKPNVEYSLKRYSGLDRHIWALTERPGGAAFPLEFPSRSDRGRFVTAAASRPGFLTARRSARALASTASAILRGGTFANNVSPVDSGARLQRLSFRLVVACVVVASSRATHRSQYCYPEWMGLATTSCTVSLDSCMVLAGIRHQPGCRCWTRLNHFIADIVVLRVPQKHVGIRSIY